VFLIHRIYWNFTEEALANAAQVSIATHPGTILQEEFLEPMGLTQAKLAQSLRIPLNRVNEMVRGKRGITPQSALLLAAYFKNSPEFWMNLQTAHDLSRAREDMRKRPGRIAEKLKTRPSRAQGAD
jgi:addiction module HigA family antidote